MSTTAMDTSDGWRSIQHNARTAGVIAETARTLLARWPRRGENDESPDNALS
jgi:hypothetical protein